MRLPLRRALAVGLLVLVVAESAQALIIDPTIPIRIALLVRIAAISAEIYKVCGQISQFTREIQSRQEEMFPREALQQIGSVFQTVRDVRQEFDELGRQWTLTVDADRFRRSLLRETEFLRDEWEGLWGRSAGGPGNDLSDLRGWSSNRRYRSAASMLEVNDSWQDTASGLARQARAGTGASAGWSLRLTAVGTSLALQQSAALNKLAAEQLDAVQEDLDSERYQDLLDHSLGTALLRPFEPTDRGPARPESLLAVGGRP
jgi:hypothetical protein